METKICTKCKKNKELSHFNKSSNSKYGYIYWCKSCIKDINKLRNKINQEQNKEYWKSYYQNNKEKVYQSVLNSRKNNFDNWKNQKNEYRKNRYKNE
jgi:superfamily II helicase